MKRLVILGAPFDGSSSYLRGAAEAPPLIREALYSDASSLWTEEGADLGEVLEDAGDIEFAKSEDERARIEESVSRLLEKDRAPIILGGDHSITYPVVRAVARKFPRLNILHFDAHPDLHDEFQGDRFSHACPFARIMEEGLAARLVQVGIRSWNAHQREQAQRFRAEVREMRQWHDDWPWKFEGPVYISFDMDALDPAFAPGVAHREPGGLTTRQALGVIQQVRGRVVAADIVEFNPRCDPARITAVACAKVLKEIAGRMLGS